MKACKGKRTIVARKGEKLVKLGFRSGSTRHLPKKIGIAAGVWLTALTASPLLAATPGSEPDTSSASEPQLSAQSASFPDGTYLYGRSPQPDQFGQEYAVFAVRDRRVVGAFYLPRSEFSCFYGDLDPQQLDLTVIHPYSREAYGYEIALQSSSADAIAAVNNPSVKLGLQGYHPISTLTDNDRRMLQTCIDDHRQEIGWDE